MSAANQVDNLSEVINQNLSIDSDDDTVPPPPSHAEEDEEDEEDEYGIAPPPPSHDEEDEESDDNSVSESDMEEIDNIYDDENGNNHDSSAAPIPVTLNEDGEDDDDNDSDNEQEYNKLELNNYQNSLLDYHQSSISHNSEEIAALTKVIRDSKNNIIDDLHKTVPILSKYERTRVLGQRAKQIENGHVPFVRVADTVIDSYIIAVQELEQKKLPFIIRRPMPSGASEYWHLKDLELV